MWTFVKLNTYTVTFNKRSIVLSLLTPSPPKSQPENQNNELIHVKTSKNLLHVIGKSRFLKKNLSPCAIITNARPGKLIDLLSIM